MLSSPRESRGGSGIPTQRGFPDPQIDVTVRQDRHLVPPGTGATEVTLGR